MVKREEKNLCDITRAFSPLRRFMGSALQKRGNFLLGKSEEEKLNARQKKFSFKTGEREFGVSGGGSVRSGRPFHGRRSRGTISE